MSSGSGFSEEEFQAQISFAETASPADPATSPPLAYGSIVAGALGGRSYRAIVQRDNPINEEVAPAAGVLYIITDYDVADADLDYTVNVVSAGATLRVGNLSRIGNLTDATGRVRGVYGLLLANTGGVGAGTPSDEVGSLVTVTMKRVDPNLHAPPPP